MLDATCDIPDRAIDDRAVDRGMDDCATNWGPRNVLAAMVRAWRRERSLRAAERTLAAMGDHTLRDIGISRGDIASFVRRGRDAD